MSSNDKNPKVVSFEEYRKLKEKKSREAKKENHQDTESTVTTAGKSYADVLPRIPLKLVWLNCPKCNTLEYTETLAPNGRHHKCGTEVHETEFDINLVEEYFVCKSNLVKLEEDFNELTKQRYTKKLDVKLEATKLLFNLENEKFYYEKMVELFRAYNLMSLPIFGIELDQESISNTFPNVIKNEDNGLMLTEFRRFGLGK